MNGRKFQRYKRKFITTKTPLSNFFLIDSAKKFNTYIISIFSFIFTIWNLQKSACPDERGVFGHFFYQSSLFTRVGSRKFILVRLYANVRKNRKRQKQIAGINSRQPDRLRESGCAVIMRVVSFHVPCVRVKTVNSKGMRRPVVAKLNFSIYKSC